MVKGTQSPNICRMLCLAVLVACWGCTITEQKLVALRTNEKKMLLPSVMVVSTLGYFRMSLAADSCVLKIERFVESGYKQVGSFTSPVTNSTSKCSSLSLKEELGVLLTDDTSTFLKVNLPANTTCESMSFTIDDTGLIRLGCTFKPSQLPPSTEYVVTAFHYPNKHLRCVSSLEVNYYSLFGPSQSEGGWSVSANKGNITIKRMDGLSDIQLVYPYDKFTIYPSSYFVDKFYKSVPDISLPYFQYLPRCRMLSSELYTGPFVFRIDTRYPLVEVLQQGGYPILTLQLPMMQCSREVGVTRSHSNRCIAWVCPKQLFLLNGECVRNCSAPYYHQIKNYENRCTLNCEKGALVDEASRTCTCLDSIPQHNCKGDSKPYPLGCYCQGGFYDQYGCVSECGAGHYGHAGICLSCPDKCRVCQMRNDNVTFLSCSICIDGYSVKHHQCIASCNTFTGVSVLTNDPDNTSCTRCQDPNCIECGAVDRSFCYSCSPLTMLKSRGAGCVTNCYDDLVRVYYSYSKFACVKPNINKDVCQSLSAHNRQNDGWLVCSSCIGSLVYLDLCVRDCRVISPEFKPSTNGKICLCPNNQLLISATCYSFQWCPLKMYLNESMRACLSCDYGCATCVPYNATAYCTSCYPGYVLFVVGSPVCHLDSSLEDCSKEHGLILHRSGICYKNLVVSPDENYKGCINSISNCQFCLFSSNVICLICSGSLVLWNNTCINQCPHGYFFYRGTCVYNNPFDSYCMVHSVVNNYSYTLINRTLVEESGGYAYYTNNRSQARNNIAGYLLSRAKSNDTAQTYFSEASYKCLQCKDGYGINKGGFCSPCVFPCLKCFKPDNLSCLSCVSQIFELDNRHCRQLYSLCGQKQFRDHSNNCINKCSRYFLPERQFGLNCSNSCPMNTTPITEDGKSYLTCVPTTGEALFVKVYASLFYRRDRFAQVVYVTDPALHTIPDASTVGQSMFLMQEPINTNATDIYPLVVNPMHSVMRGDMFYAYSSAPADVDSLAIFNATPALRIFIGKNNAYLPNSEYGVKIGRSYRQVLQHDLFYFGVVLCIAALCCHIIYIGNGLMYHADSYIVLLQTIYFFILKRFPMPAQLMQFYNGFGVAHFKFFPSFLETAIPVGYLEQAPLAYRLVNQDGNIIRNAGHSLSFVVVFEGVCVVVAAVLYLIYRFQKRVDLWHPRIIKMCLLTGFQLTIMNLAYFTIVQLHYGTKPRVVDNSRFHTASIAVAAVMLLILFAYSGVRMWYHRVGGISCFKKIAIAFILALSPNRYVTILLVVMELFYTFVRIYVQKTHSNTQFITLYVEELAIILAYLALIFDYLDLVTISIVTVVVMVGFGAMVYGLSQILFKKCWEMQRLPDYGRPVQPARAESYAEGQGLIIASAE